MKASAMFYALLICLLISALLSSLIFVQVHWSNQQAMFRNERAVQMSLKAAVTLCKRNDPNLFNGVQFAIPEEVNVKITKWPYGIFDVCSCQVEGVKDTLNVSLLIGAVHQSSDSYLQFKDTRRSLRVGGQTEIKGKVAELEAGVSKETIGSHHFNGNLDFQWTPPHSTELSNRMIWIQERFEDCQQLVLEVKQVRTISEGQHPYEMKSYFADTPIVLSENLKGFTVIASSQSIEIHESAQLENCLLIAPYVIVNEQVSGQAQIMAKDSVRIQRNCELIYPSSINLFNADSVHVYIEENARIEGELNIFSSTADSFIEMESNASIEGNVYCNGLVSIQGRINGTLNAMGTYFVTSSGYYGNSLVNAELYTYYDYDSLLLGVAGDGAFYQVLQYED